MVLSFIAAAATVAIPLLLFGLWLVWIRPYCRNHKAGFTPGAIWGITIWVDWQQAGEIARREGDTGMILVCRMFLVLQLLAVAAFGALMFFGE